MRFMFFCFNQFYINSKFYIDLMYLYIYYRQKHFQFSLHGAIDCGQKSFSLVWRCLQLLSGSLVKDTCTPCHVSQVCWLIRRVIQRFNFYFIQIFGVLFTNRVTFSWCLIFANLINSYAIPFFLLNSS